MLAGSPPSANGSTEYHRDVSPSLRAVRRWLAILFGAASLLLIIGGYWYYHREAIAIRNAKYDELQAIAALKVDQLVQWRKTHEADARMLSVGPFLRSAVGRWVRAFGDASLRSGILETLESIGQSNGYETAVLAGTDGRALLPPNPRLTALDPNAEKLVAQAVSTGGVVFGDFFRDPAGGHFHLDVAAPILGDEGRPAAVLLLRTDPAQYLYPLIQSWPTPSRTAETLLVRKDGDEVLFLNELRHRPDTALRLRAPLSSVDRPAVRAALGETGRFEGPDYRGMDVLADIRPVPGSTWFMVAKVDASEILAEARYHGYVVLLFVVLSIFMIGGLATLVFIYRQRSLYYHLHCAERDRREAQEEIRTTLYSIGDAVISTDAASRVVRMNPMAEQLTGWREAQALGKRLDEVFHIVNEQTRAAVESPAARVIREGMVVGLANHTLLIARDGTERPIADSGAPIRDAEGQINGVVLVFRDQTEQRQADRELRESRELYRTTLYSIGDAVIATDAESRVQHLNSVAEGLTGWREAEARGMPLAQVFRIVNEQTRAEVESPAARVIREGMVVGLANHTLLIARDDAERPIADSGAPIRDAEGRITGVVLVFRDQTEQRRAERELRESEQRYRSLFENMMDGFAYCRMLFQDDRPHDFVYLAVNAAFGKLTGLNDVVGKKVSEVIPGIREAHPELFEAYGRVARTGVPEEFEIYLEGLDLWLSIAVYSTERDRFVAVFDNITGRKRAEDALRESERRQVEAEKLAATGRMAARIAHEINNPLAGIKNSFRLIRDAVPEDHPDRDMVERIEREIDRIAQIVRQMYQLHSPQAQTPRDIFVAATIADVLAMLEPLCREREVKVEMGDVPADLRVWAPDGSLQQILYNLTVNGINASRTGESVNISAEYVDNNFVRMSIRDHGHGIPAELREKVFEPFFSADPADLTKHGLGLGLSIVKSIVIAAGGRIEFESTVDVGTCFHVCLPSKET